MLLDKKMRVGYVLEMYPRFSGTSTVNEISAHEENGLSVHIFSLRYPNQGRFQDNLSRIKADLTYIPRESPSGGQLWRTMQDVSRVFPDSWATLARANITCVKDLHQALQLAQEAAERNITHLHAHYGSISATIAQLASLISGIPFSFTVQAKDIYHDMADLPALNQKMAGATAVVTLNDFSLSYLRQKMGDHGYKLRRIYRGVNLELLPYSSPSERPARILAIGRLVEKKGFSTLLEACAILTHHGRNFRCGIIGSGPLEEQLKDRIKWLGIDRQVALLGPKNQAEVIECLRQAAVFVAPSIVAADGDRDGIPTALLEAMALGTPAVATDVTGIPEVISHERNGLLVDQNDPLALSLAMERLLDDRSFSLRIARNARQLIEQNFNIRKNSAAIRELFTAHAYPSPVKQPRMNVSRLSEQE